MNILTIYLDVKQIEYNAIPTITITMIDIKNVILELYNRKLVIKKCML